MSIFNRDYNYQTNIKIIPDNEQFYQVILLNRRYSNIKSLLNILEMKFATKKDPDLKKNNSLETQLDPKHRVPSS